MLIRNTTQSIEDANECQDVKADLFLKTKLGYVAENGTGFQSWGRIRLWTEKFKLPSAK